MSCNQSLWTWDFLFGLFGIFFLREQKGYLPPLWNDSLLIYKKKIEVKDRSGMYLHYVYKKSLKLFHEAMQKNELVLGRKTSTEYTSMTVYTFK